MGLATDLTIACGTSAGPCDLQHPIHVATSSAHSMRSFFVCFGDGVFCLFVFLVDSVLLCVALGSLELDV